MRSFPACLRSATGRGPTRSFQATRFLWIASIGFHRSFGLPIVKEQLRAASSPRLRAPWRARGAMMRPDGPIIPLSSLFERRSAFGIEGSGSPPPGLRSAVQETGRADLEFHPDRQAGVRGRANCGRRLVTSDVTNRNTRRPAFFIADHFQGVASGFVDGTRLA